MTGAIVELNEPSVAEIGNGSASRVEAHRGEEFLAGDPLRGMAALGVLIVHAAGGARLLTGYSADLTGGGPDAMLSAYGTGLGSLLLSGYLGLWVFFGLSGYLISRPFVTAIVERRRLPSIKAFARKRAVRILPPYWAVLVFVLVVFVWMLDRAEPSIRQVAELFVFDFAWDNQAGKQVGQAWSLGVEAKFYIALPSVALVIAYFVRRIPDERRRALAIAVPALAWVAVAPFVVEGYPGSHSFLYMVRLFAAGVALAALEPLLRPLVANGRAWAHVALALGLAGLVYVLAAPALLRRVGGPFDGATGDLILSLAVTTLIAAPLLRQWVDGGCWTLLDNRLTRWLGVRSYSLYLVHIIVMYELGGALAKDGDGYKITLAWLLPMMLAVSLVAAEVLYRTVERPWLSRRRREEQTA